MSINIYEIHIQTDKIKEVNEFLVGWLSVTHGVKPIINNGQASLFPFFENKLPELFAVSSIHENWLTILHDSYEPQLMLANKLSLTFDSTVIQVIGQSTIDTYYLSVHKEGKVIRKIQCGEDTIGVEQEGELFPFEQLTIQQVDHVNHFFDYNDMNDFCQNFGIDLLNSHFENDGHWTIVKMEEQPVQRKSLFW